MANRPSFGAGEWYHCYSRGVDKRKTFENPSDYRRFLQLLYLCNSTTTIHRSDLFKRTHQEILDVERGKPLVSIGAYALMPNHFHLLLAEREEGGITKFMRKLGIAYAMYFNIKRERVGNLFVKPFRSKHVSDDRYLKHIVQYIHLNPAELFESGWKNGRLQNIHFLSKKLVAYPYSSLADYHNIPRLEKVLLDIEAFELVSGDLPQLEEIIEEATAYYRELEPKNQSASNVKITS